MKSYLVKTTINRSINLLQSSSWKREKYLGPWLPEPILENMEEQPESSTEKKEQIQYALLVMLQKLSPPERAIYILKESLGYRYSEIASMMSYTESNCRKILSRAKQKLDQARLDEVDGSKEECEALVHLFIHATRTGNFTSLVHRLLDEVILITDGGGKTKAAYKPIYGVNRVMAFLYGVTAKGAFIGDMTAVSFNGETGIRLTRQGQTIMAISFQFDATHRIKYIYMIMNPDKLRDESK